MNTLTLFSPAKINRFLHVCGQRDDGYHNLQTVFQFLNIGDTLQFTPRPDSTISIEPAFNELPLEDNLIYKAAKLLQEHCGISKGVDIHIEKNLPQGGGIGGGSSNAATTLYALNTLWNTRLTQEQLKALGLKLGADVPIFLHGQCAWAEGIGEQLSNLEIDEPWMLLATPDCHVSTVEIFSHSLLTRDTEIKKIAAFLEQSQIAKENRYQSANKLFQNDCENLVKKLYPKVDEAITMLAQFGHAQMTGTGACAFVLVESESDAINAQQQLANTAPQLPTVVCQAMNHSLLYQTL